MGAAFSKGTSLFGYGWFVVVVGVAAVLAFATVSQFLAWTFSIVGIPFVFVLAVAPALASFLVPAAAIQFLVLPMLPRLRTVYDGGWGVLISLGLVLAINMSVAHLMRQENLVELDAIVAGDVERTRPLTVSGTIGVFADGEIYGPGSLLNCPELCQRLLLTGLADRVILAYADKRQDVPPSEEYAVSWRDGTSLGLPEGRSVLERRSRERPGRVGAGAGCAQARRSDEPGHRRWKLPYPRRRHLRATGLHHTEREPL